MLGVSNHGLVVIIPVSNREVEDANADQLTDDLVSKMKISQSEYDPLSINGTTTH